MGIRRKNKVLDTEVVRLCRRLEVITYELIDKWKKCYRYNLIESFRKHVENLRESTICALRCDKSKPNEKLIYYDLSLCSLDNIEYLLEIMVSPNFNIISNKQYADFAIIIDDIGIMVDRLIRYINKNIKTAESQNRDTESGQVI